MGIPPGVFPGNNPWEVSLTREEEDQQEEGEGVTGAAAGGQNANSLLAFFRAPALAENQCWTRLEWQW